jgi:hypothetical protein
VGSGRRRRRHGERSGWLAVASWSIILASSCGHVVPAVPHDDSMPEQAPTILTSGATFAENTAIIETEEISPRPKSVVVVFILVLTTDDSAASVDGVSGGDVPWRQLQVAQRSPGAPRSLTAFIASGVHEGPLVISIPRSGRSGVLWTVVESSDRVVGSTKQSWETAPSSATASGTGGNTATLIGFGLGTTSWIRARPPAHRLGQTTLAGVSASLAVGWSRASTISITWSAPAHVIAIGVSFASG